MTGVTERINKQPIGMCKHGCYVFVHKDFNTKLDPRNPDTRVIHFLLDPKSLTWDGTLLDAYTLQCHLRTKETSLHLHDTHSSDMWDEVRNEVIRYLDYKARLPAQPEEDRFLLIELE